MANEQGWVIEGVRDGKACWLCESEKWEGCHHLSFDDSKAIRFSRQSDAESMLRILKCASLISSKWHASFRTFAAA